jgi:hypothetical protein
MTTRGFSIDDQVTGFFIESNQVLSKQQSIIIVHFWSNLQCFVESVESYASVLSFCIIFNFGLILTVAQYFVYGRAVSPSSFHI